VSFTRDKTEPQAAPLYAELVGSTICTACGIAAHGNAPALALCRRLIEAGCDPTVPLDVYRGAVLALRIRSIGEGAKLTVEECSDGRPRFRRHRPHPSEVAPSAAKSALTLPEATPAAFPAATGDAP
jgi:hypothetical protein